MVVITGRRISLDGLKVVETVREMEEDAVVEVGAEAEEAVEEGNNLALNTKSVCKGQKRFWGPAPGMFAM